MYGNPKPISSSRETSAKGLLQIFNCAKNTTYTISMYNIHLKLGYLFLHFVISSSLFHQCRSWMLRQFFKKANKYLPTVLSRNSKRCKSFDIRQLTFKCMAKSLHLNVSIGWLPHYSLVYSNSVYPA